jgi:predicted carbohydrate-binding protein with CBM5 and CBM33 domain
MNPLDVRRLKGGAVEENKEPTTTENEDVEAHGYTERPVERPVEGNTEAPDVEAHGFVEKPVERPVE